MPRPGNKERNPDKPFNWCRRTEAAAEMLATCRTTQGAVAREVGITHQTLCCWLRHPEFVAKVRQRKEEIFAAIRTTGLANRELRIEHLLQRLEQLRSIADERGRRGEQLPETERPAGATTGLVSTRGRLDLGFIEQEQRLLEQLAKEMGHRDRRLLDLTSGGKPLETQKILILPAGALE